MPNNGGTTGAFIYLLRHGNMQLMFMLRVCLAHCLEVHRVVLDINDERVFPKPVSVGLGLHSAHCFAPAVAADGKADAAD